MLLSFLLAIFSAFSVVYANVLGAETRKVRACREQLEGIVHDPQVCANDYLKKISKILIAQSPLLWTNQVFSVLSQFRKSYRVYAVLVDAFGNFLVHPPNTVNSLGSTYAQNPSIERAWALGEGFSNFDGIISYKTWSFPLSAYVYSTNVWNMNGEMFTIVLAMNKTSAPVYC